MSGDADTNSYERWDGVLAAVYPQSMTNDTRVRLCHIIIRVAYIFNILKNKKQTNKKQPPLHAGPVAWHCFAVD